MTGKRLLVRVGSDCQKWRQEHGIKVDYLANITGYSASSIHAFEQGRVDSMKIFLAYILIGYKMTEEQAWHLFKNYSN